MDRGATEKQKRLPDFLTRFFLTVITIFYWHFFSVFRTTWINIILAFIFNFLTFHMGSGSVETFGAIHMIYIFLWNTGQYGTHVTLSVTFENWPRDQCRKGEMKRDTLCCLHFCKIMALLNFCMAGAVLGWWQVGTIVWRSSYPFYKLMKENKQ